ncbi:hypothetical protein DRJ16_07095, partial [Candidatus Woesearchaeota archaeon]
MRLDVMKYILGITIMLVPWAILSLASAALVVYATAIFPIVFVVEFLYYKKNYDIAKTRCCYLSIKA